MKFFLRRIIYFTIWILSNIYKKEARVVILSYHSFSSDGWRFSIPVEEFKKQINFLKLNYQFITANDLNEYLMGKKKILKPSILITVDDGYKDILKVKNYINELGIKPLLFILSHPNQANRKEIGSNKKFLTNSEVSSLLKDGWSIGSHGATHTDFHNLSILQKDKEIVESKRILEKRLNINIQYLAYPKGRYDNSIIRDATKVGYQLGFSMDDKIISAKINKFKIPRIGVDGSHSFLEFTILPTFWAIQFRKTVKKYLPSLAL